MWLAILLLLASGYWMLFTTFGGFAAASPYIHLMQMIGWLMIALFVWLFHGPWLAFKRAVDEDWPSAGTSLNRIRQIICVNRRVDRQMFHVTRSEFRELAGHAGHLRPGAGRAHAPSKRGRRDPCSPG